MSTCSPTGIRSERFLLSTDSELDEGPGVVTSLRRRLDKAADMTLGSFVSAVRTEGQILSCPRLLNELCRLMLQKNQGHQVQLWFWACFGYWVAFDGVFQRWKVCVEFG